MADPATPTPAWPRLGRGSPRSEGVRGSATVPLRPAPPGIHDPRPRGRAGRGTNHLGARHGTRPQASQAAPGARGAAHEPDAAGLARGDRRREGPLAVEGRSTEEAPDSVEEISGDAELAKEAIRAPRPTRSTIRATTPTPRPRSTRTSSQTTTGAAACWPSSSIETRIWASRKRRTRSSSRRKRRPPLRPPHPAAAGRLARGGLDRRRASRGPSPGACTAPQPGLRLPPGMLGRAQRVQWPNRREVGQATGGGARLRRHRGQLPRPDGLHLAEGRHLPARSLRGTDPQPKMFRWYVVNTYSGHENKVKQNLEHRVVSLEPAARGAPGRRPHRVRLGDEGQPEGHRREAHHARLRARQHGPQRGLVDRRQGHPRASPASSAPPTSPCR